MEPAYRYRAEVGRVVDGDTIDAVIDLGFYIEITERLRLEGLDTPEIHGVAHASEEYKKGIALNNSGRVRYTIARGIGISIRSKS